MSNYDILLAEAKSTVTGTAKHYIPKLYEILTQEEHKPPEEARSIIEHDLALYWTKAIISRHLPPEAKDKDKVKAGKIGAEVTNLVLAEGQTVTTESDDLENVRPNSNDIETPKERDQISLVDEPEEPTPLELANIRIAQLEDALKKMEQFKPATSIPIKGDNITHVYPEGEDFFTTMAKKADGIHSFYYDTYGIDLFKNRELSQLKNSGVKVFKRLYFEV